MIYNITCWFIAFIYSMILMCLCKNYIKYYRGDKVQLILIIADAIFIVLILLLPLIKIILGG